MHHSSGYMLLIFLLIIYCTLTSADEYSTNAGKDMLNSCLDSLHHKSEPGPEGDLYNQCYPWKDRACCRQNTTQSAHHTDLYGFTYDHCGEEKKMSVDCRRHFMQDLCFYECSPNIGPWIVKVSDMKIRKERYFEVPLCQKDCDAWFRDCSDDYTCTDNWSRNFMWRNGRNNCPEGSTCHTFAEVYGTAENFCRKVWDHSWKPVPDEEPCMRLWFNPAGGNPNERVAQIYAARIAAARSGGSSISCWSSLLPVILVFFSWIIYG